MSDSANYVMVYAPQGRGKTAHADALCAVFGCTSVLDDWDGIAPIPEGALVLTSTPFARGAAPVTPRRVRLPYSRVFIDCTCTAVDKWDCTCAMPVADATPRAA